MKRLLAVTLACTQFLGASIINDALKLVPDGWTADTEGAVVADFNSDGDEDIAIVYYALDPEFEIENRTNRILVALSDDKKLRRVVDQGLPWGEDFGVEINLDYVDGILKVFQHRGIMHQFNEWGLTWDETAQMFMERTSAWGGIAGLGSSGYHDALTGTGSFEKVWDDVDISVEYADIYAKEVKGEITIDGKATEPDWEKPRECTHYWVNWGSENWGDEADASMRVKALYDPAHIYLFIEVADDDLVLPNDPDDLLNTDHLELWIDRLTPDISTQELDYVYNDWERKADEYTVQIAVAESKEGKVLSEMWLPEEDITDPGVNVGFSYDNRILTAELSLPWDVIRPSGTVDYFSFSVVYSDSDNRVNPKQETLIGTSTVRWAEPFTFGGLLTFKPEPVYWGIEPLEDY
ncbi:hypothetical protein GF338_04260 [candidate division WOR-3 bacterium]|nr:hypothetical protein [candidate division WOR-3 bacterium]